MSLKYLVAAFVVTGFSAVTKPRSKSLESLLSLLGALVSSPLREILIISELAVQ